MSKSHPVIAVTGSSGAGTTSVRYVFEQIFRRLHLKTISVGGDSFHRYNRTEMREHINRAVREGSRFSHFALEANMLEAQEALFREYGQSGGGKYRCYIHSKEEGIELGDYEPGNFTPWRDIPADTDLLFYEGLHGGVVTDTIDVARYVDLLIGVAPIVNLEWIQKIHRDTGQRGYKAEDVTTTILRRMHDYVHVITPQFSRTDINFQRVPTVDTSNPFMATDVPTADESFVVISFTDPEKFNINFPYLLSMINNAFMSRCNTLVIPGAKMGFAMKIIFMPIIEKIILERDNN